MYVVYKVNQYQVMNIEGNNFGESIQIDFMKFEVKHFNVFDIAILRDYKDYCYPHGF